jgi:hypothetical protein
MSHVAGATTGLQVPAGPEQQKSREHAGTVLLGTVSAHASGQRPAVLKRAGSLNHVLAEFGRVA